LSHSANRQTTVRQRQTALVLALFVCVRVCVCVQLAAHVQATSLNVRLSDSSVGSRYSNNL